MKSEVGSTQSISDARASTQAASMFQLLQFPFTSPHAVDYLSNKAKRLFSLRSLLHVPITMSTIATPRSSSVQGRRIASLVTPTSSTRPSFETGRNSPSANQSGTASPSSISAPVNPRRNRAALREYYNLKKDEQGKASAGDDAGSEFSLNIHEGSEVRESELDREGFVAEGYVRDVLEKQSLGELLRTYNGVLTG